MNYHNWLEMEHVTNKQRTKNYAPTYNGPALRCALLYSVGSRPTTTRSKRPSAMPCLKNRHTIADGTSTPARYIVWESKTNTMKSTWLIAISISGLLALPLALASILSASPAISNWPETLQHPGFWLFYGKAWLWLFFAGTLASIISLEVIRRRGITI